jgi:hypothetical protein
MDAKELLKPSQMVGKFFRLNPDDVEKIVKNKQAQSVTQGTRPTKSIKHLKNQKQEDDSLQLSNSDDSDFQLPKISERSNKPEQVKRRSPNIVYAKPE